jgi:hypothetical protein
LFRTIKAILGRIFTHREISFLDAMPPDAQTLRGLFAVYSI